jgi:hypothetical protein
MKRLSIFLSVVLFGLSISTFSQHHKQSDVNNEKRTAAIKQMVLDLTNFFPDRFTDSLIFKEVKSENGNKHSIRLIEKGILRLSTADWIYFLSSSSHNNPEIGDITLAIDSKGNIFQNNGHVCGGIIHFETTKNGIPTNSEAFFKFFESDTDGVKWEIYKNQK